jgi:alkanesulfonate monooxygenase SsuD/methylene tetrahydromethanopterin reductase-like flavin-dependent oxidoreductase (luciferase family)
MPSSASAPQIGVLIPEPLSARETLDFAVSLEGAGVHSAWFTEIERDAFVRASAVAARTSTLRVGTGIALWTRTPVTAAVTAAGLHQVSDGRFMYGVGSGAAWVMENWHNTSFEHPARRMSEYIRAIRGVWGAHPGQPFDFDGDYYSVHNYEQSLFADAPPLYLAAVGEGMLRLAARHADGVLFNPASTPWYCTNYAAPQLLAGAQAAGRQPTDLARLALVRCAIDSDRSVARAWAKHDIAEYGRYPIHQRVYGMHGFEREAAAIADAMSREDTDAGMRAVTEEMVATFAIAGTADDAREQMKRWVSVIDTAIFSPAAYRMTVEEVRSNCEAIRDAFSA